MDESGCKITGKYNCIQDIAQESEILFDIKNEEE